MMFWKVSPRMKKTALLAAFIASLIAATALWAQGKDTPTAAPYIAMIFHKLSGTAPDYDRWAMASESYTQASRFDKAMVREQKATELKSLYSLVTLSEPVVISAPVRLSKYSLTNKGFLIDSFKSDTYFGYEFAGNNYAIVIPSLLDHQWIDVDGDAAKAISNISTYSQGRMRVLLYVEPKFADKSGMMQLGDRYYWLISGQIKDMVLTQLRSDTPLWRKSDGLYSSSGGKQQKDLMNLYQ